MPKLKLLILDAGVVIKLHEMELWSTIVDRCDIYLSTIVACQESKFHEVMIPPPTSVISTGQLAVVFYQSEPVTEKVQARRLRVGLYAADGELISDSHDLKFDLTSENARERELKVRLLLSKQADNYNQQQIMLKMEEPISDTSQYKEYKSVPFTLRRSFTSDFD